MIYLIIPPIIIIVCMALLLFLFSRKSPQLYRMNEQKKEEVLMQPPPDKISKIKSIFSEISLKFLEHWSQRTKVWFLKLHNLANSAFHKIREKRKNGKEENKIAEETKEEAAEEKKDGAFEETFVRKISEPEKAAEAGIPEEKISEPMVSKEAVQPETRPDEKNEYEQILIDRIAANPKDIEAYERLGDYYIERKNYVDAKECFSQVLKLNPGYRRAKMKMRRLEKMLKVEK